MTLDTFIGIVCLVGAVVCYGCYRYFSENVYIKTKYQRGRYIHGGTRNDY